MISINDNSVGSFSLTYAYLRAWRVLNLREFQEDGIFFHYVFVFVVRFQFEIWHQIWLQRGLNEIRLQDGGSSAQDEDFSDISDADSDKKKVRWVNRYDKKCVLQIGSKKKTFQNVF